MAPTVVFVTGANRGLGLGLVEAFVAKLNHVSPPSSFMHDFNQYRSGTLIQYRLLLLQSVILHTQLLRACPSYPLAREAASLL